MGTGPPVFVLTLSCHAALTRGRTLFTWLSKGIVCRDHGQASPEVITAAGG